MVMSWQDQGQLGHGKWWPGTMALPLLPPVVMEAVHNCTGAGTHTHHHVVKLILRILGVCQAQCEGTLCTIVLKVKFIFF